MRSRVFASSFVSFVEVDILALFSYKCHQCCKIPGCRGFKCLTKLCIIVLRDFLVIIAFCRERMVNEHIRVILA